MIIVRNKFVPEYPLRMACIVYTGKPLPVSTQAKNATANSVPRAVAINETCIASAPLFWVAPVGLEPLALLDLEADDPGAPDAVG
jgi:hypothetical protein